MTKPFTFETMDPRWSPDQPVTVNGFLYLPAEPAHAESAPPLVLPPLGRRNRVVEVTRRRLVERT